MPIDRGDRVVIDESVEAVVSIDPGDVHCGVALWRRSARSWRCEWAVEMTPGECVDYVLEIAQSRDRVGHVICEGYKHRPDPSDFGAAEIVGVCRHVCRRRRWGYDTPYSNATKATRKRLNAAKYRYRARGHGTHAHDAEAVGVHGLELSVRDLVDAEIR